MSALLDSLLDRQRQAQCAAGDVSHNTPTFVQAKRGAKRVFASQSDADSYDGGVRCFEQRPRFKVPHEGTPAWHGYKDAERIQLELNAARAVGNQPEASA